jgi:DNA-nicking Smr family endonuclease
MKGVRPFQKDSVTVEAPHVFPEKIILRNQYIRQQQEDVPKGNFPVSKLTSRDQKNIQLQGRIDLHGHTQEKACLALLQFFKRAQSYGHKWVLVITGKGEVLQTFVPQWFETHAVFVIAYGFAEPKDGGKGAFYVRVRKAR